MRVLVACEFSGVVRRAFRARGHDAWSCDLLPAEDGGEHLLGDARYWLKADWDLLIAHPPCTHLSVSGARWFESKREQQAAAVEFFYDMLAAPVKRIALENPVSVISSKIRKPNQIIQPHGFGHPEFKAICLWLKGLKNLEKTNQLQVPEKGTAEWKKWNRVHRATPGPERWKERSRFYDGVADAMAVQWGGVFMEREREPAMNVA
jgi:site-specific DNA-cytosine methylase